MEEIRIDARRERGHVLAPKFVSQGLLILPRYGDDVVKGAAHFGFDRSRFPPLRAQDDLSKGIFFHFPFSLPQQEFDVVLEHYPWPERKIQQGSSGVQKIAEH